MKLAPVIYRSIFLLIILFNFLSFSLCNLSGKIVKFEVVDGGLICSSGVLVEEMGDKNDDCYIVNAAVYVGY